MRLLILFSLVGFAVMASIGVGASIAEIRVVSSSDSGDRLSTLPSIPLRHSSSPSSSTLIIDTKTTYQKIQGFGGAITEASMHVLSELSSDKQEEILEAYYGASGHRYSMARVHMNSCDFSLQSSSFDEKKDDFELEYFDNNVMHDQWNGMIPFAKKALNKTLERGDQLDFFFSPWSPPAWMKGNGQMTGSSQPCLKAGDQYKQSWANYYVKFIEAYAKHGIDFWGLTVQNEPEYAAPWEACTYTAEEERDFVRDYLGPALFRYNRNIKLMIHDHNKDHVAIFAQTILSDPKAAQYVWGSAVHWYSGDEFSNLDLTHRLFPDKQIYASEACICPPAADYNDWSRAEKYAHDIIGDLNNYVVGWTDWNILLDSRGSPNHLNNFCDAPIRVERETQKIHYQPIYYALGHFSRFLRPGAIRIAHEWIDNTKDSGLELVVFFVTNTHSTATSGHRTSPKGADRAFSSSSSFSSVGGHAVITVMNPRDNAIKWVLQLSEYSAEITSPAHSLQSLFIDAEFL